MKDAMNIEQAIHMEPKYMKQTIGMKLTMNIPQINMWYMLTMMQTINKKLTINKGCKVMEHTVPSAFIKID